MLFHEESGLKEGRGAMDIMGMLGGLFGGAAPGGAAPAAGQAPAGGFMGMLQQLLGPLMQALGGLQNMMGNPAAAAGQQAAAQPAAAANAQGNNVWQNALGFLGNMGANVA
jgi:hypothetical protein